MLLLLLLLLLLLTRLPKLWSLVIAWDNAWFSRLFSTMKLWYLVYLLVHWK